VSFWQQNEEYTYGAIEDYSKADLDAQLAQMNATFAEYRYKLAWKSRDAVLNHEKFKQIFAPYADAIGISKEQQELPMWKELKDKIQKHEEEQERKRLEEELKKQEEEKKRLEEEQKKKEQEEAQQKIDVQRNFFKLLKEKNLLKYVGQAHVLRQLRNNNAKAVRA